MELFSFRLLFNFDYIYKIKTLTKVNEQRLLLLQLVVLVFSEFDVFTLFKLALHILQIEIKSHFRNAEANNIVLEIYFIIFIWKNRYIVTQIRCGR